MASKNFILLFCFLLITSFLNAQCLSGNCEDGTGVSVIDSTIIYSGSFKNNLPHGSGKFSNAFGLIYEGGVWKGLYQGSGKLSYNNGDLYVGDFAQGLRHGKGIFTSATGITMNGRYINDRFSDTTSYANTYMGHQLFTNYSFHGSVFSSDNKKVAVLGGNNVNIDGGIKVFDVETGKLLERVNLKGNGCRSFTSLAKLYLDFGREYETHLYDGKEVNTIQLLCPMMEKIYPKNSSKDFYIWRYEGKSSTGQALFWIKEEHLSTSNQKDEDFLIAYENSKAKPATIIKRTPYVNFIAVSPDLKRVLVGYHSYCYIKEIDSKKETKDYTSLRTEIENKANMIAMFNANGDTLTLPEYGIYSGVTGQKIQDFNFVTRRLDNFSKSFSNNLQWTTGRTVFNRITNGNLICLLKRGAPNYLLPLIDPVETETTIRKTDNYYGELYTAQREIEAKNRAEYARQMEKEYGIGWRDRFANNPLQQKTISPPNTPNKSGSSNHNCQVCSGSGRAVDEMQESFVQDKNSGRWYKKMGTVYRNCYRCGGKGYVTY